MSFSLLSKNVKIIIYRNVILRLVCVGVICDTWLLTLWEKNRLRVFENRVLRILRPKRDGIRVEWRKVHNEKHNDLYCSPNVIY
jgi:hypothetical protein